RNFPETFFQTIELDFLSCHSIPRSEFLQRDSVRCLDIEDDPGMPSAGILPYFKIVIGDTLDFGVKVMAFEVQLFAADLPLNLSVADIRNLAALADESFNIEKRQELAQPGME